MKRINNLECSYFHWECVISVDYEKRCSLCVCVSVLYSVLIWPMVGSAVGPNRIAVTP